MVISPQPRDIEGTPIQSALTEIIDIQNINMSADNWYEIILDSEDSKQLVMQPADRIDWHLSTSEGGDYFTMRAGAALEINLVTVSGASIGWVSPSSNTTFQILIGR